MTGRLSKTANGRVSYSVQRLGSGERKKGFITMKRDTFLVREKKFILL